MLRFHENSAVNRMSAYISDLDVGDRILKGRINLFTISEKGKSDKLIHARILNELEAAAVGGEEDRKALADAPEEAADVIVKLLAAMNLSYPDYDFSSASPDHFVKESFAYVFSDINYQLSFLAERQDPGFVKQLWDAIQNAVDLPSCQVYSYRRRGEAGDPEDDEDPGGGFLFAFDYFFFDKILHKLLYFSCVTRKKSCDDSDPGEDSGAESSERESPLDLASPND